MRPRAQQEGHAGPYGGQLGGGDQFGQPGGEGLPGASAASRPVSTERASPVSGSPAHPHSRVRSLSSVWKVTPWSMP